MYRAVKLLSESLDLFSDIELSLVAVHSLVDFFVDLGLQRDDLDLSCQHRDNMHQLFACRVGIEQQLLVLEPQHDIESDSLEQLFGICGVKNLVLQFLGHSRQQFGIPLEGILCLSQYSVKLDVIELFLCVVRKVSYLCGIERLGLLELDEFSTVKTLHHASVHASGRFDYLLDLTQCACCIEILLLGLFDRGILLCAEKHEYPR